MWTDFLMTFSAVYLAISMYNLMDTFIKGVIYDGKEKRKYKHNSKI
jgi:hypothetical protein